MVNIEGRGLAFPVAVRKDPALLCILGSDGVSRVVFGAPVHESANGWRVAGSAIMARDGDVEGSLRTTGDEIGEGEDR